MSTNNFYNPLIESFDCIGWIPTIRGSLSLDLLDSKFLLGDVDKYLIDFEHLDGYKSSRYIVSSSLVSYDDKKHFGNKYVRAFRFFFRGTINNEQRIAEFFSTHGETVQLQELFKHKELLIGKISIVLNLTGKISENEILALNEYISLSKIKDKYKKAYLDDAVSLDKLKDIRDELKCNYETLEHKLRIIESLNVDSNEFRIWEFDVVLSRDGILFLKNCTNNQFLNDFYSENSADDYKKNVPIHRVFKIAMTYIKYMFHKHYHHKNSNDTFLPVTNLHPIYKTQKISKITDHQIEFFLKQITKYKREPNRLLCNPGGVTNYARSFLDVFGNNGFIDKLRIEQIHNFINYQENDTKVILEDSKKLRDFFLTQRNILASLTIGLTLMLASISITRFILDDKTFLSLSVKNKIVILAVSFISGFILQRGIVKQHISKNFNSKLKKNEKSLVKKALFINSNLDKGRLSLQYKFYLSLIETKLYITKIYFELIAIGTISLFILTLIALYSYLILFKV